MKKVKIAGREVFPIGLGTLNMGDKTDKFAQEVEAIRAGLDHGVQVIDTAEMYGNGNAESLVGHAIEPFERENLFLVSKVLPNNASKKTDTHQFRSFLKTVEDRLCRSLFASLGKQYSNGRNNRSTGTS